MRTTNEPISYPLYIAGLATVLCGLAALNSIFGDDSFFLLTAVVLCAGYATSIMLRKLGYTSRPVEFAVVAVALIICAQLIAGQGASRYILPMLAMGSSELRLAAMLLWLEVLRSFTLVSDDSVVFAAIPSVVLMSLAAINNVNMEMMVLFIIFLGLSVFLMAHRPSARTEVKPFIRIAGLVTLLSLVMGLVLVVPVRLFCMKAFAGAMPGFTVMRERYSRPPYTDFGSFQIAQGPVRLSDVTVMTVQSRMLGSREPVEAYWRGKVFDRYTGHGWDASASYTPVESPDGAVPSAEFGSNYGGPVDQQDGLLEQIVRMDVGYARTVYSAAEPVMVQSFAKLVERNDFNCWRMRRRHRSSNVRVLAALPETDPRKLRAAGTSYSSDIRKFFLQRVTSTARVGKLARKITAGAVTPYDKARVIESYLGEKYTYDLNAPPVPAGRDAVDYFLFESGVGYCDVFASAMAIMCREVGVPARVATGFAPGIYDPDQGVFRVRDSDRHAWAEVYFPGCGWVTFDPTAYTNLPGESWASRASKAVRKITRQLFGGPSIVPIAVLLIVVSIIAAFGPDLRSVRIGRRTERASRLQMAALARYRSFRRILRSMDDTLTPIETSAAPRYANPDAQTTARRIAELFSELRYATRAVTREDIIELDRLLRELKSATRVMH